ncbi:MAG: type I-E CRISPR-associated protein Cas5/CasD [Methanocorpusculum sp.]|jgi:CRISPR-associated protein Cas5t|nr:type I-E CRISPR-associated protein Cas5/CasD [Methanocorpusculum sp.]
MFCFYVKGTGVTASFRVPETHTFHQTLPLPSRTMMIGLMGAALGLSLEDAHTFAEKNKILVSVSGTHEGIMKDLWNYRKVTTKEFSAEELKSRPNYSVLTREYLVNPSFTFVYAAETKENLEEAQRAFESPVYALTAGNSDDLLKVQKVSSIEEIRSEVLSEFENTVLPGDVSSLCTYDVKAFLKDKPVTFSLKMPEVFSLPTGFSFKGNIRTGVKPGPFTFVSNPVSLKEPLHGYVIGGKNYVLY